MMRCWRWRDAAADTPVRWRCVHPTIVRTVLRNTIYAAAGWRSSASFQEHSFSLHLHLRLRSVPAGARSAGPPSLKVTGASPLRGPLDDGASVRRPDPHRLAIPPRRSHRRRTSGAGGGVRYARRAHPRRPLRWNVQPLALGRHLLRPFSRANSSSCHCRTGNSVRREDPCNSGWRGRRSPCGRVWHRRPADAGLAWLRQRPCRRAWSR